jgi:histidine kinase-like protein
MFSIGEFARHGRVSVRMLRHYDGRLPSPRWRWPARGYVGAGLLWIAGALVLTVRAIVGHHTQVDPSGNLIVLTGSDPAVGWWNLVEGVFFPLLGACWLASLVGQALGFRRSAGERRQQLKWLMAGSALAFACVPLAVLTGSKPLGTVFILLGFFALPACIGVAILRYRLFDIDRIISRTLAYAVVTGLLVGVYAGLVLLATQVHTIKSPVAVAAATLAAAALFNPVRFGVQRVVDRRFNRARYDADKAVADFAARLQDTVDPDAVHADLLAAVHQALEPAHLSVWLSSRY